MSQLNINTKQKVLCRFRVVHVRRCGDRRVGLTADLVISLQFTVSGTHHLRTVAASLLPTSINISLRREDALGSLRRQSACQCWLKMHEDGCGRQITSVCEKLHRQLMYTIQNGLMVPRHKLSVRMVWHAFNVTALSVWNSLADYLTLKLNNFRRR